MNNLAFGATRKLLEPQFSPQENGSDSDSESGSSESSGLETAFRWLFKWGDQKKNGWTGINCGTISALQHQCAGENQGSEKKKKKKAKKEKTQSLGG